jgi:hypothetical protein
MMISQPPRDGHLVSQSLMRALRQAAQSVQMSTS